MCNKVVNETLDDDRDKNQQSLNMEETMSIDRRRRRIESQYGTQECHIRTEECHIRTEECHIRTEECHIRTITSVYIVKEYFLRVIKTYKTTFVARNVSK
jgi:hypothetical protein